jgi:hypothetical protein
MPISHWILWALLLIAQNFAFTFVSRARNSGSIQRHAIAAVFSNGVYFINLMLAVSAFMGLLTGKFGWKLATLAAVWYTIWTVVGSLVAHWWALKTEKGKSAVGASKKYVQITKEEWDRVLRATQPFNVIWQTGAHMEPKKALEALQGHIASYDDEKVVKPAPGEPIQSGIVACGHNAFEGAK